MSNEGATEAAMQALQALRDIADRTQDPNQLAALEGLSKLVSDLTSEAAKLNYGIAARCQRFTAQCMIGGHLAMPSPPGPPFAHHPTGAVTGQLFPGVPYPYVGAGLPGPVIYWPPGTSLGQPGGAAGQSFPFGMQPTATAYPHPYGLPGQPHQFAGQQTNAHAVRQKRRPVAKQPYTTVARQEATVAVDMSPDEIQRFLSSPTAFLAQPQKNSVTRRASHVHTSPEGILMSVVLTRTMPAGESNQTVLLQVLTHNDEAAGEPGYYLHLFNVVAQGAETIPTFATTSYDSLERAVARFNDGLRLRLQSGYTLTAGDLRHLSLSVGATPSMPQHPVVQVQPKQAAVPGPASGAVKSRSPLPPWMSAAPFKGLKTSPAAAIVGPLNGGSLSPSFSVRLLMPSPYNIESQDKFFILQVIRDEGRFVFFRVWGRVKEYDGRCQSTAEYYDSVESAAIAFADKFLEKTANLWSAVAAGPASFRAVSGRYVMESYLLGTKTISAL